MEEQAHGIQVKTKKIGLAESINLNNAITVRSSSSFHWTVGQENERGKNKEGKGGRDKNVSAKAIALEERDTATCPPPLLCPSVFLIVADLSPLSFLIPHARLIRSLYFGLSQQRFRMCSPQQCSTCKKTSWYGYPPLRSLSSLQRIACSFDIPNVVLLFQLYFDPLFVLVAGPAAASI